MSVVDLHPAGPLDQVPDLPRLGQRWTVRRKAAVIQAVRGSWVPIAEICERYNISMDELLAWERDQPTRHEYFSWSPRAA